MNQKNFVKARLYHLRTDLKKRVFLEALLGSLVSPTIQVFKGLEASLGAKAKLLHQVFSAKPKFLFKDCFVNCVDKTIPFELKSFLKVYNFCLREDSNLHTVRQRILNPPRLPFRH